MKKHMIRTALVVLLALAMLLALGCTRKAAAPTSEEAPEVSASQEASPAETYPAGEAPTATLDECVDYIRASMEAAYGDKCSVELRDSVIDVRLWQDQLADAAEAAVGGDEALLTAWDSMAGIMTTVEQSMQEYAEECGFGEYTVEMRIFGDQAMKDALLVITGKGEVTFDAVRDADSAS